MRGLIGETWRLLRTHGPAMLLVALVFLVPAELAVAYAKEDSDDLGVAAYVALALIGYAWVYGALIATISRRDRSPLEPYGRTVDRVPALVARQLRRRTRDVARTPPAHRPRAAALCALERGEPA